MLRSLHGKGKTPLMLLCWVIIIFRLFVSSWNRLIESMASLKEKIGHQIVGFIENSLFSLKFDSLSFFASHSWLCQVHVGLFFLFIYQEILIEMHVDAMYARLHVQKCKKPLNELFHASSKCLSLSYELPKFSLKLLHRAAALATGCQISLEYGWGSVFDLRQNKALGMPHKRGFFFTGDC